MQLPHNITPIDVLHDPNLLGQFREDQETWRNWDSWHRAFYALPPEPGDLELLKQCSGRSKWPSEPFKEACLIIGTRGGKTKTVADTGTIQAVFRKHDLSPGEIGRTIIVAPTIPQSRIVKDYFSAYFSENDFLRPYLLRETANEIQLSNNTAITVISSDYRSLRGFTAICCIIDEIAYMNIEGSKPDIEVVRALRSRLLSTGGPLIYISSPYSKRGFLYDIWKKHYGVDDSPILVWQAPSALMNPTLNLEAIEAAKAEDPEAGQADYDAIFRSDIESYLSRKVYESAVVSDRFELRPASGLRYMAFCDPSGGSSDSMTLAICHIEDGKRVLDCIREAKSPFSPENVVADFARTCKKYGISTTTGDRYAGLWPRERFEIHGIRYIVSKKSKSELYLDFLPLINSGEVELLDNKKLKEQFLNLERRTGKTGKDVVDHPARGKDDIANAVAGVIVGSQIRQARSLRPERSRRKLSMRRMFPGAVRGGVRAWDRDKGEIIKIR